MARAHAGASGERFHPERPRQILPDEFQQRRETALCSSQVQERGELRLAAGPAMIYDELLSRTPRYAFADILAYQGEREVDARRDAGRSPQLARLCIDAVCIEAHGGKLPREVGAATPV